MFNAVVNKIKDAGQSLYVAFALSLEDARDATRSNRDQVFIIPMSENHEDNARDTGPALQRTTITFGALIVLNVRNDPTGERSEEQLKAARNAVKQSIYGWSPTTEHDPILLSGGELLAMDGGKLYWLDQFKTRTYEESQQ